MSDSSSSVPNSWRLLGASVLACLMTVSAGATAEERRVVSEKDVVALALDHNPTLAAAKNELERARLLVAGEEARYGLVVRLDQTYNRNRPPTLTPAGVVVANSDSWVLGGQLSRHLTWGSDLSLRVEGSRSLQTSTFGQVAGGGLSEMGPGYGALIRLRLTQPLWRGFGRDVSEAQLATARVARASAEQGRNRSASEALRDTLSAYWELYYASHSLEIQRQSRSLALTQREDTAARVKTGSLAPVELLSFDTRVATLDEDVATAAALERQRGIQLAQIMGLADAAGPFVAARDDTPPDLQAPLGDLRSRALEAAHQLRELRESVRLAEVQALTAAEPFRPRLDLDGYVQAQGLGDQEVSPAFDQIGDRRAISAFLSLVFEAPLDSTQQTSEYARARLAVEVAKDQLSAATQKVVADLDVAIAQDGAARQRLELGRQTLDIATRQLAAEAARFATGSSTALQVSQAQDQLRSASLRVLRAQVDLVLAHATMSHLTGELFERWAAP